MKPFLKALGFKLTSAQINVLSEIRADMNASHPMRRLLQGDVGSGKTLVAAASALLAIESGHDVALMAPTELLAEQHFRTFEAWFRPLEIEVLLHTGREKMSSLKPGSKLFVGTHALIEQGFQSDKLGLVIVDEQHKFGVSQRDKLVKKGNYPHLLVMTATPIPRTLGLTLYGDLDISIINELPGGRGALKTYLRTPDKLPKVWRFVRDRLTEGRQVYVVYPRIEDTGEQGVKAVNAELGKLETALQPFKVGLMHGRLHSDKADRVMRAFRQNELQVLLATTVIEVGVDVPNATIMIVENAEQFGLSQLHQIRGRIGRGQHDSHCILIAEKKNEDSWKRLEILEATCDGFQIAEEDMKIRGPGEMLGRQQSGMPTFKFADLTTDYELVKWARNVVTEHSELLNSKKLNAE